MIQLVIPMSGQGVRFQKAGYAMPKALIPVNGLPMIERLVQEFPAEWPTLFIVSELHRDSGLIEVLKKLRPQCEIECIPAHTLGPGQALKLARAKLDPKLPILVSYCDYGMIWDARQFERFVKDSECDGCVISYRGFHPHYLNPQTYAYSRIENERVVEIREKGSFTNDREKEFASSGAYYFKNAQVLNQALDYQIDHSLSINGEYYTSLTLQALLQMNPSADVRVFEIPFFFQWGTPSDLEEFEYWEQSYRHWNREVGIPKSKMGNLQILMPMAGFGSRMKGEFSRPKPLIEVGGVPMFRRALSTLPSGKKTFVTVTELEKHSELRPRGDENWIFLPETPEGQALTVLAGLRDLDPHSPVLVSACDHGLVIRNETWEQFLQQKEKNVDAAIFTVRGFPQANRTPEKFAYVEESLGESPFPRVVAVSVKKPISSKPSKDALLVGSFWFKSVAYLSAAIETLKKENVRVNGEFYLDSVFTSLIQRGDQVVSFPVDGYVNWGDLDSLAVAEYWREAFTGQAINPRARFAGASS